MALIEKSLPEVTVSVMVTLCEAPPSVPVIFAHNTVPVASVVPAEMVAVEALPAVTEVGLKLTVGPTGEELALSEIVLAEPLKSDVLIVAVALLPCWIERLDALELIVKSLPRRVNSRTNS